MTDRVTKTVIIGGVAGGATAAARLRRLDERADIVVLEKGGYVSYANCGLPYHLGGVIEKRDSLLLQTPAGFAERYKVEVRLMNEVTAIDPARQTVTVCNLETGERYEEAYDNLILSPGARPVLPEMEPGAESRVFTLHTIADMDAISSFISAHNPKTVAVLGGGFIGVEAAENLAHRGLQVTLIQRSGQIIPPLDLEMALWAHTELRKNGVELLLDSPVASICAPALPGSGLDIKLATGGSVQADFLIAAIGVRPDNRLATEAGLAIGKRGGIVTDEHMRSSDPHIYAVGDAVEVDEFVSGTKSLIALAGPANKQARIAADNICGIASSYKGTQGSVIIKVFGLTVAVTGINEKTAKGLGLDYDKVYFFGGSHAGYYPNSQDMVIKMLFEKGTGRILGAQILGPDGADKRCDVVATAIRANMTATGLAELELCYAPPYSSAKDPVNVAGYMIQNLLTEKLSQYHWHEVDTLPRDGSATLLDVRTPTEFAAGHIEGFSSIPVDELRARLTEIDPGKPVYLVCHSGLRSYIASRILIQNGLQVSHLCGGWRFYRTLLQG